MTIVFSTLMKDRCGFWGTGDEPFIHPKTKGAGIMVSNFVDQHSGCLSLTKEEHQLAYHIFLDLLMFFFFGIWS